MLGTPGGGGVLSDARDDEEVHPVVFDAGQGEEVLEAFGRTEVLGDSNVRVHVRDEGAIVGVPGGVAAVVEGDGDAQFRPGEFEGLPGTLVELTGLGAAYEVMSVPVRRDDPFGFVMVRPAAFLDVVPDEEVRVVFGIGFHVEFL